MQNAVSSSKQPNLEEYNPFDAEKKQTTTTNNVASAGNQGDAGPAVMNPTSEAPPAYTASGQQQISAADFEVNFLETSSSFDAWFASISKLNKIVYIRFFVFLLVFA